MAHIIGDFLALPKITKRTQVLSCMENANKQICKKDIYDADAIQKRIDAAAKVRAKLDAEIKERDEKLKKINFYG